MRSFFFGRALVVLLVFSTFTVEGQNTTYDYLTMKSVATLKESFVGVFSSAEDVRLVPADTEKGDDGIVVRSNRAYYKAVYGLIQEYEGKGWELFQVDGDGSVWIMRKPKQ